MCVRVQCFLLNFLHSNEKENKNTLSWTTFLVITICDDWRDSSIGIYQDSNWLPHGIALLQHGFFKSKVFLLWWSTVASRNSLSVQLTLNHSTCTSDSWQPKHFRLAKNGCHRSDLLQRRRPGGIYRKITSQNKNTAKFTLFAWQVITNLAFVFDRIVLHKFANN